MLQSQRFWRLNFSALSDVEKMVAEGTIITPTTGIQSPKYDADDCIARRMKSGDGIFLGKLDEDTGRALIEVIGIIENQNPVTTVTWKIIHKTVYPNSQGGFQAWRERCFLFNRERAVDYNLPAEFLIHFPERCKEAY